MFQVAHELRMPLYKLTNEMPYEELLGWLAYFSQRPIGWREDDRTFKFLQTQGVKEKPYEIFPSLQPIYNTSKVNDDGSMNMAAFKGSHMFMKLLEAKGGDKLDFGDK